MGVNFTEPALEDSKTALMHVNTSTAFNMTLCRRIRSLLEDAGFAETLERRSEYWLMDGVDYYFENMDRFAEEDFEPSEEDLVMTRIRTTGVVLSDLHDKSTNPPMRFTVVDVGGQRSERRKWIHCFDDVKAVLFLAGLTGYNQVLFEDQTVNRMKESLALFGEVIRYPQFKDTPIFLLLNKKDLFELMIKKASLKGTFPEYNGPDGEVMPAIDHIKGLYQDVMNEVCPGKAVYIHVIAARVRLDMKVMFQEVKEVLQRKKATGRM